MPPPALSLGSFSGEFPPDILFVRKMVPEELPNQRFGLSLAPILAPTKKPVMVRVLKQSAKGWIRYSESSPFDQSRSLGSRRTIWPFMGMTDSWSESPLPSR
jgi:hypothetical protein